MDQLTPNQAQALLDTDRAQLIDVREPQELELAALPGATFIPMGQLAARLEELPREQTLIIMCHHGVRSAMAGDYLERNGFSRVCNLSGGIDAWSREVDPSIPRY